MRGLEDTPYIKWLTQDVAYIISNDERKAFKSLQSDPEREHFIEQFWQRRDPTPGTSENEMKEEHYRRIAYVNPAFRICHCRLEDRSRPYLHQLRSTRREGVSSFGECASPRTVRAMGCTTSSTA